MRMLKVDETCDKKYDVVQRLDDLLVEFDEMNFVPMTLHPKNPYEYAREWKENLLFLIRDLSIDVLECFSERLLKHYPHTLSIQRTIKKELKIAKIELYDDGQEIFG